MAEIQRGLVGIYGSMMLLEPIAVAFGIACVYLTVRQNIWCWPTGLVQVSLYIVIFYQVQLYSDVLLHMIYVFLQLYGWYHWLHGGRSGRPLAVTSLESNYRFLWLAVAAVGTLVWGYLMASRTDAAVPYGDAFTTVTSLVAQWLMARKRLESWFFWIAVDCVAIGIYWYRDLYLTSMLYLIFLVLAVAGWRAWSRTVTEKEALAQ